ncbi:MAG TPA: hypothetical protein VL737_02465 [Candidatus Pristimantibacillus sp.]|nr:hypothetical protein [Candidatus Pristimantibacillus sp.]
MKIGIAGSMQFTEEMFQTCEALEKLGHTTFMSMFGSRYVGKSPEEIETLKLEDKNERDAIKEFWKPMQDADALLVLNYDRHGIKNYIGGNAFLEMGFAHVLGQKIYLLNPIPDMPFYGSEIVAMKPTVLNGDLSKIG